MGWVSIKKQQTLTHTTLITLYSNSTTLLSNMGRNKAIKRLRRQGLKINPTDVIGKGLSTRVSVNSSSSTSNEIKAYCGYGGTANLVEHTSSRKTIQQGDNIDPYIACKTTCERFRWRDPTKAEQIDIVKDLELMKMMRNALQKGLTGVIEWTIYCL